MANARNRSANPSETERKAKGRADRKQPGVDRRPETQISFKQKDAANHTKLTVKQSLKRGSQEIEQTNREK